MTEATIMNGEKVVVANGPECLRCGLDTFDDWWHDRTMKPGAGMIDVVGRLKCHGCGLFFHVERDVNGYVRSSVKASAKGEGQ